MYSPLLMQIFFKELAQYRASPPSRYNPKWIRNTQITSLPIPFQADLRPHFRPSSSQFRRVCGRKYCIPYTPCQPIRIICYPQESNHAILQSISMHVQKNFIPKPSELEEIRHIVRFRNSIQKREIIAPQKQNATIRLEHEGESITIAEFVEEQFSNHESSLKICPHLLDYILHAINQVYIFYGDEEQRLDTFMGNPNDPGMLMVLMVYLMQEKYKLTHSELQIKVSFMESNGNEFSDLLTDQKLSLKHIQLCTWIKINEYLQYLKAIKLALYSNKKRDFKVSKFDDDKQSKDSSIFIARIRVKLQEKASQIMLVDVPMQKKKEKGRNDWQSFLHSLNKEGSKAEPNQLAEFLLEKLNRGVLTITYSMSLLAQKAQLNLKKLKELQEFLITKPLSKVKFKQSQLAVLSKTKIDELVSSIISTIKTIKYDSIQHLQETLANLRGWKSGCLSKIKQLGQTILKLLDNKIKIGLYNYNCYSERRDLIGKSVKSQNLKQFYSAKTYQSLYREVDIKTEESRKNIRQLLKENLELKSTFHSISKHSPIQVVNQQLRPLFKSIMKQINSYFLNEKIGLRETPPYWIYFSVKRVEIEDKVREFDQIINSLQPHIQSSINIKECSFKQDGIISQNNLLLKATKFIEPKSQCILPRLMFKRITQTQDVPQRKFEVRLSDFLLKLPRN